jgi:methylenetetrahydrofolate--tRNA-(uracil-5-)-methyltransferase
VADLIVVGAGLAGSEAAWQAAERGLNVLLYEMRPTRQTPAHRTDGFAELVCSNSLRGAGLEHAVGLLKEEMRRLGSLIMAAADAHAVPGGAALAVDRTAFSAHVTAALSAHPRIAVRREVVTDLPEGPCIVATGPLTAPELAAAIARFVGSDHLAFYDAAAPIVTAESIDWSRVYKASRYGKGDAEAYVNCPFTKEEYLAFWEALRSAEQAPREPFDPVPFFEGCLPVEEMARRGVDTLRYGPLKPVGLPDPRTGRLPYAVAQLRPENREGTLYNLVGFQTSLRFGEQRRVFRMIPGLEHAEFERYGVMHKNLFLCSPRCLEPTLQSRRRPDLWFAGQMTGVEGYVESAATGIVAGLGAVRLLRGLPPQAPPPETMIGALCHYVAGATGVRPEHFQPMNAAWGLLPPLEERVRDRATRRRRLAERALAALERWKAQQEVPAGAGR